jgi:restriction endonuclease S subunit
MFITEDKAREFERSTVKHGDLILTCWGTIDQVGLIDERSHYEDYVISNKAIKMTPDPAIADSRFLYHQFSSPKLKSWTIDNGIGSSTPGFSLGVLKSIELNIPPLPNAQDQRRAEILELAVTSAPVF